MQIIKYFGSDYRLLNLKDYKGETPLTYAAKYNRASVVQYLCAQGADVRSRNLQHFTAGHYAAACGSQAILQILHENQDGLLSRNIIGWTPLHYALKYKHVSAVEYLLKVGAVLVGEEESPDLIHLAASVNSISVVRALLQMGGQADAANHNSWTFLSFAASNGHTELMRQMKSIVSQELYLKVDRQKRNLAHLAAIGGHLDVLEFLDEIGFTSFNNADSFGKLPLHYAAEADNFSVIPFLLQKNDVNSGDRYDNTALHLAAVNGSVNSVKLLLESGNVNIEQRNKFDRTPLFAAVSASENGIALFLMQHGANPNTTAGDTTLIMEAISCGSRDLVAQLCKMEGVDIFRVDSKGWSPVHYAAQLGDVHSLSILESTNHEAIFAPTSNGRVAIDLAAIWNHREIIVYYSQQHDETDFMNKDIDGNTAMHHAIRRGHTSVVRELLELVPQCLNERNKKGQTPLHLAIEGWKLDLVAEFILSGTCDLQIKDWKGRTPFLLAVSLAQSDTVDLLLTEQKSLDPNDTDNKGNTAAHLAAGLNSAKVLMILHSSELFDFDIKNSSNMTPFDIAAEKQTECLKYMAKVLGVALPEQYEEEEDIVKDSTCIEGEEEEEAPEENQESSESSDFLESYAFGQVKKQRTSSVPKNGY